MKYLAIFLMIFLLSCQDIEEIPRPDNLISEDKMIDVLTEVALMQGARSYNKNLLEEKGIRPRQYIYEKYDIDSLQFRKSSDYYSAQYEQYQEMYEQVKVRLESLRVVYDSIRKREERRKDSVRRLESKDSNQEDISTRDLRKKLPPPMSRRDSII